MVWYFSSLHLSSLLLPVVLLHVTKEHKYILTAYHNSLSIYTYFLIKIFVVVNPAVPDISPVPVFTIPTDKSVPKPVRYSDFRTLVIY